MADDTSTPTETDDGSAEDSGDAKPAAKSQTPRVGMQGLLTRDTDIAARPGFRNPANKRSKASKKKRRKNRK